MATRGQGRPIHIAYWATVVLLLLQAEGQIAPLKEIFGGLSVFCYNILAHSWHEPLKGWRLVLGIFFYTPTPLISCSTALLLALVYKYSSLQPLTSNLWVCLLLSLRLCCWMHMVTSLTLPERPTRIRRFFCVCNVLCARCCCRYMVL